MSGQHSPLRISAGFIIHQSIGYVRDFDFNLAHAHIPPDLDLHQLSGLAKVTRTPQGLLVQVQVQASYGAECVRCLTSIIQPIKTEFAELYAFTRRAATESGLILPEDGIIDLEPLVREYILLASPIGPLCRPDCKGLCPVCGENRNDTDCGHEPDVGDPRLSQLKDLLK